MPEPKPAATTHRPSDRRPQHDVAEHSTQRRNLMQQPAVWITGARLHFGLLDTVKPFGGGGMMVDRPETRIRIERAERFESEAVGTAAARVAAVAERFARATGADAPPACRLQVLQRPLPHSGLGTGTQLALAVAAGLDAWAGHQLPAETLVRQIAGRGARSTVGSDGFFQGGLLTDPPLPEPLAVNDDWRVLLVRPTGAAGAVSGDEEKRHFDRLPAATASAKQHLRRLLYERLVPAAAAADFDAFSDAAYCFNHGSGMLFAAVQGGPYNGAAVARVIGWLRQQGVRGVGQSSWGPTVFAFCRSAEHAQLVADRLTAELAPASVEVAQPLNRGARVSVESDRS